MLANPEGGVQGRPASPRAELLRPDHDEVVAEGAPACGLATLRLSTARCQSVSGRRSP
jgi:hypothetical protein